MMVLLSRLEDLQGRVEFWIYCLCYIEEPGPRIVSCLSTMAQLLTVRNALIRHKDTSEEEAARYVRKSLLMVEEFQSRLNRAMVGAEPALATAVA